MTALTVGQRIFGHGLPRDYDLITSGYFHVRAKSHLEVPAALEG